MTLWRVRTDTAEPQPLADLKLDLDGSLWERGRFVGWLHANGTAGLHPDWLRDISAVDPEPEEPNPEEPALE